MNVVKMAQTDANRWAGAEMLSDEIANKIERLPEYAKAFNEAHAKIDFSKHLDKMNDLRDKLDKMSSPKHPIMKVVVYGSLAAGVIYLTGADKPLVEQGKKLKARARLFMASHNL